MIDRIVATESERLLEAIGRMFTSTQTFEIISFSTEQIEMLLRSEQIIRSGNFISENL